MEGYSYKMKDGHKEYYKETHTCPYCGTKIEDGFTVCTGCQAEVTYNYVVSEKNLEYGRTVGMGVGVILFSILFILSLIFKLPLYISLISAIVFMVIGSGLGELISKWRSPKEEKITFHRYRRYS